MKKTIRLTESDLQNIIKETLNHVLKESNNRLSKSFKSKEDMTQYRDLYSPNDDEGPYLNNRYTACDDGYDYCGDDDYNEYVNNYNRGLKHRLSTKGGQMSYDWEQEFPSDSQLSYRDRKNQMEKDILRKNRKDSTEWSNYDLKLGKRDMERWLDGKYNNDDLEFNFY